jgi:hypothetical protein
MTAALFIAGAVMLAAAVLLAARRYLAAGAARAVALGLPMWLLYVGALSRSGVIADPSLRPPAVLFIMLPVFLFIGLFAVRSASGAKVAASVPIGLLIGAQVFRVPVELGLHRLWSEGLVPRLMTYEGGNVDIVIGLTAPLAAWLATRGDAGRRLAIGWSVLGLLALVNIVVRSALTAPGPLNLIHAEPPNLAIGIFPYTFLAGFFAPLAVLLHVLGLRALTSSLRSPIGRWSVNER